MKDKHIPITKENKVDDSLLIDLLLEMGIALGLDCDKPVTAVVSMLSHKDDDENTRKGLTNHKNKS